MTEKKPRKPNWTSEEMEVLAEAYLSSYKVIRGKLTPVVTSEVKKRAWENITDKVNAVSLCLRTVEETRKRLQDVQSCIKKKEAYRKKEADMTGGGPPTEITFKPWELTILSTISPVSIYGIEGGADTGKEECAVKEVSGPSGDCYVPPGLIVTETVQVDVVADAEDSQQKCSTSCEVGDFDMRHSRKIERKTEKQKRHNGPVNGMEDLLELKRKRLEIEERKVHALERIATVLERQQSDQMIHHSPSFSVSPIIKFH